MNFDNLMSVNDNLVVSYLVRQYLHFSRLLCRTIKLKNSGTFLEFCFLLRNKEALKKNHTISGKYIYRHKIMK